MPIGPKEAWNVAAEKLGRMKSGDRVITNDSEMDTMLLLGDDAVYDVRSLPAAGCCAEHQYVAWIV